MIKSQTTAFTDYDAAQPNERSILESPRFQLLQVGQRALPVPKSSSAHCTRKLAQLLDVVPQLRIVRQRLALGDFRSGLRYRWR